MGYIVHGILQARILEWIAIPFSKGSSQPRDQTQVSCNGQILYQLSYQRSPIIYAIVQTPQMCKSDKFLHMYKSRSRYGTFPVPPPSRPAPDIPPEGEGPFWASVLLGR